MECKQFWDIFEEKGLTDELKEHLAQCESCREEMEIEHTLGTIIENLPLEEAPKEIWNKVSQALPEQPGETGKVHALKTRKRSFNRYMIAAAAALLIMVSAVTVRYFSADSPEVLAQEQLTAIAEIEQNEKEYLESIERLSKLVDKKKDSVDQELYTLYMQRIDVLDDVILMCREAIDENRYNINARTYLAEAYREKVDTLKKIAELS